MVRRHSLGLLDDATNASSEVETHDEATNGGQRPRDGGAREEQHGELPRLVARKLAGERTGQVEHEEPAEDGRDGHEQGKDHVQPERYSVQRIRGARHVQWAARYLRPPFMACPILKMGR